MTNIKLAKEELESWLDLSNFVAEVRVMSDFGSNKNIDEWTIRQIHEYLQVELKPSMFYPYKVVVYIPHQYQGYHVNIVLSDVGYYINLMNL